MPSRPVAALIALFWIATIGWFGYQELLPKFHAGDAPPYEIDLSTEVYSQLPNEKLRPPDALWRIYRDDNENDDIGRAQTRLRYLKEDDTFELESRVVNLVLLKNRFLIQEDCLFLPEMINRYHLNRNGELLDMEMVGEMALGKLPNATPKMPDATPKKPETTAAANFVGTIRGGTMYWTGTLTIPGYPPIEPALEPVPAPRGIFLNPLHPVFRVKVQPGRRWQMQVVDPLSQIVGPVLLALQQKLLPNMKPISLKLPTGAKSLAAEVLTETKMAKWNQQDFECWVIEYRGDNNEIFRTFVRKSDGQVLRQESQAPGGRFVIQRQ